MPSEVACPAKSVATITKFEPPYAPLPAPVHAVPPEEESDADPADPPAVVQLTVTLATATSSVA